MKAIPRSLPSPAMIVVRLQAGDFVQAEAFQQSGDAVDVLKTDENSPEFSMTWLAPGP